MRYNILIIDDDKDLCALLKKCLEHEGINSEISYNGVEGLINIAKNQYHLIVLDIMMPMLDGFETLKKIRELSSVPVLMLTSRTETSDKIKGLEYGADDYLTKPFVIEEFIARVNSLIRRYTKFNNPLNENKTKLQFDGLIIDFEYKSVIVEGKEVERNKSYQLKLYVDRLFEWAKLYSNEYRMDMENTDISDLTRQILVDWIPVFEEYKIDYKIDIPEYRININIDTRAYETILSNIIQNVIRHSKCSNIIIELIVADSIMMKVRDNGIGISQEELIHIFDRLYKVDKSRGTSGNGLGLSIVKQLIESLNGNIIVNSELNQGTEFQIIIPKNLR